jgi:hypothetical protein
VSNLYLQDTASVREKRETLLDNKMRYDVASANLPIHQLNDECAATLFLSIVLEYG